MGAPITTGQAMNTILQAKCADLARVRERLPLIAAHDALLILRNAVSASKLLYILRCSPCTGHPALEVFDEHLRSALSTLANCQLTDIAWIQASLPVANGGLGIRSVALFAPSAFLASAAATSSLQLSIFPMAQKFQDPHLVATLAVWSSRYTGPPGPEPTWESCTAQKAWDQVAIDAGTKLLADSFSDKYNTARILACQAPHSGEWLHVIPISACGLRLDDEAIRVAIGLRLGLDLCAPHACPCGNMVDARGAHGISCRRSVGRITWHNLINDIVFRAFTKTNIPAPKEPHGLVRADGRRPDGATLIPWSRGKCLTWDVTVPDTLAQSYLAMSSQSGGATAEFASVRKWAKYASVASTHIFCPVACETMGPINLEGL